MDSSQEEVDHLLTEAEKLGFTLQHLSERRSLVLRQINAAKASTRALSTETLTIVLKYACTKLYDPEDDPEDQPYCWNMCSREILNFSHVSSRWRSVAFSISQLWQEMSINVHKRLDIQRSADILSLHFQNVRGLPFSLRLLSPEGVNADPIADVLFQEHNSCKVEHLELRGFYPREWLSRISRKFQRLHFLICDDAFGRDPVSFPISSNSTPLVTAPNLKSIILTRSLIAFETCWESITTLELTSVVVSTCVELLFHCTNLVEFTCFRTIGSSGVNPSREPNIASIHTFPRLIAFTWTYTSTTWDEVVVKCIRLPVLETISWICDHGPMEPPDPNIVPALAAVLRSASTTLSEIEFVGQMIWTESHFRLLLSQLKHVYGLWLIDGQGESVANLVSSLTGPSDDGERNLLPSLITLVVGRCCDGWHGWDDEGHLMWVSSRVVQMLQSRLDNSKDEFILDIRMDWTCETKDQVRRMIRNGAKLRVFDEGKEVEWLTDPSAEQ